MKRFLILVLAIFMVFAMVACKQEVEESADPTNSEEAGKAALAEQGASGSKGIDNKGFKIIGTFTTTASSAKVEVGGKDGLYWIGTYTDASDKTGEYVYFRMKDANTVSIYTGEVWADFEASSIKDALFKEGGIYSAVVDNIVYLSFQLQSKFGKMFGDLKYAGSETKEGVVCSKYTATFSIDEIGEIAEAFVYVEPTFAVTVGFDFALTDSFVKKYGDIVGEEMLKAAFSYKAEVVDFDVSTSEIPNYATIAATIGK